MIIVPSRTLARAPVRALTGLLTGLALTVSSPILADAPNRADSLPVVSPPVVPSVVDSANPVSSTTSPPSYADLVDLLEPAPLVLEVQIRKVAEIEPERARGVRSGWARTYVEARGVAALRGALPAIETISYLADVPLDAKGKLPALNKHTVLLVARPVTDHPEMVQLVAPDAQLPWDAELETRVRAVLAALQAPDAPAAVTGVREAIYVPGTLVGEGETQIFLTMASGSSDAVSPATISVLHQPGKPASWSVSFSEVVDASGQPPAHDTLTWYRLACFLPRELPDGSNVSETPEDRAQAVEDYKLVLAGLGVCGRTR